MKRDALCDKCTKSILKQYGWRVKEEGFDDKFPTYIKIDKGERHILKKGWANSVFMCDLCDNQIDEKSDCSMRSIFKSHDEYYSWESEMITKATTFVDLLKDI